MSESSDFTKKIALLRYEILHEISKDIKQWNRLQDDRFSRTLGIATVSFLIALPAGRALSRHFASGTTRASLFLSRLGVFGALNTFGTPFNGMYSEYRIREHPQKDRIMFIKENQLLCRNYIHETCESVHDFKRMSRVLDHWNDLMTQEPLYRNQEEFEELIRASEDLRNLGMKAYESVDSQTQIKNAHRFLEWYNWPAIHTVYGFKIRNTNDGYQFAKWLEEQQKLVERPQEQRRWSLRAPEKGEDFWEWFNDEKTGKPVFGNQSGLQSSVDSESRRSQPASLPRSVERKSKRENSDGE